MNDKWKKIICFIVGFLISFSTGILIEQCRNRQTATESGELTAELKQARAELEQLQIKYDQQLREVALLRRQAREVGKDIDKSIGLAEQAGESLRRVGQSIQDAGRTATTGRELIDQLRSLNQELTITIRELQDQNTRLTEELRRLQSSTNEQQRRY